MLDSESIQSAIEASYFWGHNAYYNINFSQQNIYYEWRPKNSSWSHFELKKFGNPNQTSLLTTSFAYRSLEDYPGWGIYILVCKGKRIF